MGTSLPNPLTVSADPTGERECLSWTGENRARRNGVWGDGVGQEVRLSARGQPSWVKSSW